MHTQHSSQQQGGAHAHTNGHSHSSMQSSPALTSSPSSNGNGVAINMPSINSSSSTLPMQQTNSTGGSADGDLSTDNDPLLADDDFDQEAMQKKIEKRDRDEANRRGQTPEQSRVEQQSKNVIFLCLDLTHLSSTMQFILLSSGVLGFFLLNSWLEEYLFKELKNFTFGWYMTAFELMCFACFAIVERWLKKVPGDSIWSHQAAFRHHLFVAFCMTMSRGLTNKSLQYLNYPTQVIFKSMKLITVMIGSLIILKQKFTIYEYVSAVALVLSAILFSLGDASAAPEVAGYVGIVIVCLSLVADALHSNTQEQLLKQHRSSILEAMLYTNLFAALMCWVWVILTGEFLPAYEYCQEQPVAYILFVVRAGVIYLGVLCFVLMINTFGVVKATAITTVRKILTIIVSFILFPKPISSRHVLGFLIFTAGICLSVYDQRERAKQPRVVPAPQSVPLTQVKVANS